MRKGKFQFCRENKKEAAETKNVCLASFKKAGCRTQAKDVFDALPGNMNITRVPGKRYFI